jgi:hypothetical protein
MPQLDFYSFLLQLIFIVILFVILHFLLVMFYGKNVFVLKLKSKLKDSFYILKKKMLINYSSCYINTSSSKK